MVDVEHDGDGHDDTSRRSKKQKTSTNHAHGGSRGGSRGGGGGGESARNSVERSSGSASSDGGGRGDPLDMSPASLAAHQLEQQRLTITHDPPEYYHPAWYRSTWSYYDTVRIFASLFSFFFLSF